MVLRVWHHHRNTVFHQGAEQGAAYGDLRGVENYPGDVFNREGERLIATLRIDNDLTTAMSQSGGIGDMQTTPCHVRTSDFTSERAPKRSTLYFFMVNKVFAPRPLNEFLGLLCD